MGAWGAKYFDNDDAGDFMDELDAAGDWVIACGALEIAAASAPSEYLQSTAAGTAVAAAAAFAQKAGKLITTDFPDDVEAIDAMPVAPDLSSLALKAIARIRGPKSELADLWRDAGDEEWIATLDALEGALR